MGTAAGPVGLDHRRRVDQHRLNRDRLPDVDDLKEFGHVDFKSEMVNRPQGGGTSKEYATLAPAVPGPPAGLLA